MKRFLILLLVLLLVAVSVSAQSSLVNDGEGLLSDAEVAELETLYADYALQYGFTPILVTTESFDGYDAEDYAGDYYDSYGYPEDGILLLVSLTESQWYILTNGECYRRISDWDAEAIGKDVVELIRDGEYCKAFAHFPELAKEIYSETDDSEFGGVDTPPVAPKKAYGKTIAICMGIGLLIGLITVGVMAARMKSVRLQTTASDYVRPGSMQLSRSRDIFLYSHVSRTPKPKSNSSGGSSGGSRGGAGGRI